MSLKPPKKIGERSEMTEGLLLIVNVTMEMH